ncbi:LOW QUALITY PROTEIN: hypothetical protein HID58_043501, partial [Brassica napus]
ILSQTSSCLCSRDPETRDHLLLSCEYNSNILIMVLTGPLQKFLNGSELLAWIRSNQTNNSNASTVSAATMEWKQRLLLWKMVTQAVVFHIWKQHNNVFTTTPHLPLQLFSHY